MVRITLTLLQLSANTGSRPMPSLTALAWSGYAKPRTQWESSLCNRAVLGGSSPPYRVPSSSAISYASGQCELSRTLRLRGVCEVFQHVVTYCLALQCTAPHPVEVEVHRLKCSRRTPFCMASHPNDGAVGTFEKTGDQDDGEGVDRAVSLVSSLSLLSTEVESDLVANVSAELGQIGRRHLKPQDMERFTKACKLPLYLKFPMYQAISKMPTRQALLEFCRKMHQVAGRDRLSKAVFVLTKGRRTFLQPCDFKDLIQDLIDTHSGLSFLKKATRSHIVYIDTVVARLFFEVGKTWTWRLGMAELRRSDFLSQLDALELHNDFMNVEGAFSYKDAYVIHTMFNSLDKDN
ncbi:hypothetical protein HPB50_026204 [Hyalomma asiaticum]|uniref:Uncharacterized protein n=1 Tax=Hyalomma asiaticum TaxID=266040 RepID=A0ACB7SRK8_HYAAI|nr:hypothetical protein HPB50_026204 [Hyalomma asiaticum]